MPLPDPAPPKLLICCPTGRDGPLLAGVLQKVGITAEIIPSMRLLCERLLGADAAIIAAECLDPDSIGALKRSLAAQQAWSDFPLIVLGVPNSSSSDHIFELLSPAANLTLLERPTRPFTLITIARAALRARERQYLTREQLEQLIAARAEADRAGRMKDEFLATLSHELRTPLNAVSGWAALLRKGSLSPEDQAKAVDTIARNAQVQKELVEDLLDMSRIVSGKVKLDVHAMDLVEVVSGSVETVRPTAQARQIALTCTLPDGRDTIMNGDPARLQQVVWNLVNNAVKFTPQGGSVRISLERQPGHIVLTVADSGSGIEPEFLPYVFDRFRQADASMTRRHGGLGLGLSIVKQLVEMHGGEVRAASPGVGQGATFTVTLPVDLELTPATHRPARPPAPSPPPVANALSGRTALVVDDSADSRELVQRLLTDAGMTVFTAPSAEAANDILQNSRVDVIISDIGMAGVDGYDFIRSIRSAGVPWLRDVPAAALTAFARSEDRSRALAAGYTAHVAKPVDEALLLDVVARLTRGAARRPLPT